MSLGPLCSEIEAKDFNFNFENRLSFTDFTLGLIFIFAIFNCLRYYRGRGVGQEGKGNINKQIQDPAKENLYIYLWERKDRRLLAEKQQKS